MFAMFAEKHNQHFSVTAFPQIVGNFLQEDILQYKDNIDDPASWEIAVARKIISILSFLRTTNLL